MRGKILTKAYHLKNYPEDVHFAPHEWIHRRDRWLDLEALWNENEQYGQELVACAERSRYGVSAGIGRECKIIVARGASSREYSLDIYKRRGMKPPTDRSRHEFFQSMDSNAYEIKTGRLVPPWVFARYLEAAGFNRVAVILDSKGVPIGTHADVKPGGLVSVGYNPVYPGREIQHWYGKAA